MKPSNRRCRRIAAGSGSVLVCVIVCLSIATALVTATTQSALRSRQHVGVERQLRQAELLLDAAARQAVMRIGQSEDYAGEMWLLGADALPGFRGARIEIDVGTSGPDRTRRIRVTAQLPADAEWPVRCSLEVVVRLDNLNSPEE